MRLLPALLVALSCAVPSMASAQAPAPTVFLLRPARVFDGVSAKVQEGWVVLVRGDRIAAAGPAAQVTAPLGDASVIELPGTTLVPGLIEGALAPAAAPLQRDLLERSGAPRAARPPRGPRHQSRPRHAARRLHHRARPRHRGRRRRRRRAQAGHRAGHHPRAAPARHHPRARRHGQLRAQGLRPRVARPPGRRGGRWRRRPHPRRARADRARAPTGSRCTATTAGAPTARRGPPSPSRS